MRQQFRFAAAGRGETLAEALSRASALEEEGRDFAQARHWYEQADWLLSRIEGRISAADLGKARRQLAAEASP